jgi:hypothetical protein
MGVSRTYAEKATLNFRATEVCAMDDPSFVRAMFRQLWALISSAVLTLIGFYALVANKGASWVIAADLIAAVLLFDWAAYGAWKDERNARLRAEAIADHGRPRFALEVREEIHNYDPSDYYFFWITDCAERSARNVTFDPISSKRAIHHIRLDPQPFLPPLRRTPLTFHCGDPDDTFGLLDGNPGRLRLFCDDNPNNETKLYFPVTIRFLDGDRQLEEHHTLEATVTANGPKLKMYPTIRPD